MTKAKLIIEQPGGDPVEADIVVDEFMEAVVVVITSENVQIHSPSEPRVVTT